MGKHPAKKDKPIYVYTGCNYERIQKLCIKPGKSKGQSKFKTQLRNITVAACCSIWHLVLRHCSVLLLGVSKEYNFVHQPWVTKFLNKPLRFAVRSTALPSEDTWQDMDIARRS